MCSSDLPYAHDDWITQRHKDLNYRLKPLVRMLKRWNNVHSKYLKGFHLEVVTATVLSSLENDSRGACEKFFDGSRRISTYWILQVTVATHLHKAQPPDDLVSVLVHAEVDGARLGDDEIVAEVLLLLIGGDETTRHTLSSGTAQLLRHPAQDARLVGDLTLLPKRSRKCCAGLRR